MVIYCDKCGARHECSVCPVCAGFGLSNLQAAAGLGKSYQPGHELRAKFEAWAKSKGSSLTRTLDGDDYWDSWTSAAWAVWQAAHASRDAEVEALRKDAERYRWIREKRSGEELTLVMNYEFKDLDEAIDVVMQENNTDKQE